jgi:phosphate transport system permease protein
VLVALASVFGLPIGVLTGLYLAEHGHSRLGSTVRFCADVLNGVPSIVVGIFAYTLVVLPMKGFSAYAGGIALGVIMLPIIARTNGTWNSSPGRPERSMTTRDSASSSGT